MTGVLSLARPDLLELEPYSHAHWDPRLERLHANENPWRPAGDVTDLGLNRYPEPYPQALADRMAAIYGVTPDRLVLGRGSDEVIDLLVRAFCRAGRDAVLTCPPTFGMYKVAAQIQGAPVVEVPLLADRGFALDAARVVETARDGVKIVFLCSPNNPTGNLLDPAAVEHVVAMLAGRALVVVDEAYIEFADRGSLAAGLDSHPHLVVLRTLSKAHALAGARCGAALADPGVIGLLKRLLPPYAIAESSIEAVQRALVDESLAATRTRIAALVAERERMRTLLPRSRLVRIVWPSDANFLLVACHDPQDFLDRGIRAGLLVRDVRRQRGLGDCMRVTIGSREQNDRLLAAVEAT
ncbi:MAG: histidinol-phosphate transaminase [Steroidobacteraceae bacterium]